MNFIDGKLSFEDGKVYATFDGEKILLPEEKAKKLNEALLKDKVVTFGIRPEHLSDDEELIDEKPEEVIGVRVEVVELMGAESYIYTKNAGSNITIRVNGTTELKVGQKARVHMDPTKIHVFDKETEVRLA